MTDTSMDTAPAPSSPPPSSADAGFGPTLPCRKCGAAVLAGYVRCPSCGGSPRPLAAGALAALAGLSGLVAAAVYGREMAGGEGAVLRPAFYALTSLGTLVAGWSIFQGRRAGWVGVQVVWALQIIVPLLYAMLRHRGVVGAVFGEPWVRIPLVLGVPLAWLAPVRAYCSAPSNLMTMTRRELGAFLFSPVAYVIMTAFLFFMGLFFYGFVQRVGSYPLEEGLERVFGNVSTLLIFCSPLLTMRLLAEEKKTGTIEILMTAPVTELEIVLSKFLATLVFFAVLIAPTGVYVGMLAWLSMSPPDYGAIAGGYVGLFAMAAVYFALGLFISSLTRNQIVAAIVTFVMFVAVWVAGFFADQVGGETFRKVLEHVNFVRYYESFGRGIVDSRAVIYYLSLVGFSLFLTVRSIESRRWS